MARRAIFWRAHYGFKPRPSKPPRVSFRVFTRPEVDGPTNDMTRHPYAHRFSSKSASTLDPQRPFSPISAEAARAIEPLCMLWLIPGFLRNEWNHAFKLLRRN